MDTDVLWQRPGVGDRCRPERGKRGIYVIFSTMKIKIFKFKIKKETVDKYT